MDSISFSFFIVVLNVLTTLSAHLLVAGLLGDDLMCSVPLFFFFFLKKRNANSSLVNTLTHYLKQQLADTSGFVKQCCNTLIEDLELVLFNEMTSTHFEK